MNEEAPLNPNWLKARMLAEKIIEFEKMNEVQIEIGQNIVEITVSQDILDGINNKKDKLEALEKEIAMKIVLV